MQIENWDSKTIFIFRKSRGTCLSSLIWMRWYFSLFFTAAILDGVELACINVILRNQLKYRQSRGWKVFYEFSLAKFVFIVEPLNSQKGHIHFVYAPTILLSFEIPLAHRCKRISIERWLHSIMSSTSQITSL